jgi:hypothetical protein
MQGHGGEALIREEQHLPCFLYIGPDFVYLEYEWAH